MKNDVIRTEFGVTLRRMRLKCGLTQQAVADALHVNRATYSYYELGKTQPDFSQLGQLAKIFGVTRETLPLTWNNTRSSVNTRNSQPIGGSPSAHRIRPPRSQTHWDSFAQRKSLSLRCIVCAANRTKRLFGNSSINWRPRTHLNFWLCS